MTPHNQSLINSLMLFNEQVYNIPRNVKINDVSLLGTASVMRV